MSETLAEFRRRKSAKRRLSVHRTGEPLNETTREKKRRHEETLRERSRLARVLAVLGLAGMDRR